MDRTTAAGKVAALNFLMPYVQRLPIACCVPNGPLASLPNCASTSQCCAKPCAAPPTERRSEVKPKAELLGPAVKPAERQSDSHARGSRRASAKSSRDELASTLSIAVSKRERLLELLISQGRANGPTPPLSPPRSKKKTAACSSKFSSSPFPKPRGTTPRAA